MTEACVLFVDDEPHILAGLRRMLRGQSKDWEMLFAASGEEALQIVTDRAVDAVVSDMRMPGMNGAQLLAAVQQRRPATARLILSGQADRDSVLAAINSAQQFLAKPCDADVLVGAVSRVLSVHRLLHEERLRDLVGGVGSLPKPPDVYQRLVAVTSRPGCDIAEVAAVVNENVATCAELLKLVNTAFFGMPRQIDSVERAVGLIGLDTLQHLVLASSVFGPSGTLPPGLDSAALQRTGLMRAAMTRRIATAEGWDATETNPVVLAALMRDLGLLVLSAAQPKAFAELVAAGAGMGRPVTPAERAAAETEHFGCTVPEASAYLLGLWGFADLVVHTVAGQPVDGADIGAAPAEHALSAAHWRATLGDIPVPISPGGFLDAGRAERWNACCDEVLRAT